MYYKIYFVENNDQDALTKEVTISNPNTRDYTIDQLKKWTEYKIWVLAGTSVGDGPNTDPIIIRTDEDGTFNIHIFNHSYSFKVQNHFQSFQTYTIFNYSFSFSFYKHEKYLLTQSIYTFHYLSKHNIYLYRYFHFLYYSSLCLFFSAHNETTYNNISLKKFNHYLSKIL